MTARQSKQQQIAKFAAASFNTSEEPAKSVNITARQEKTWTAPRARLALR
jgi:hypothetical protein